MNYCLRCYKKIDANSLYNMNWYPLSYCSDCNMLIINYDDVNTLIELEINKKYKNNTFLNNIRINDAKNRLNMLFKNITLSSRINVPCHMRCNIITDDRLLCQCNKYAVLNSDIKSE